MELLTMLFAIRLTIIKYLMFQVVVKNFKADKWGFEVHRYSEFSRFKYKMFQDNWWLKKFTNSIWQNIAIIEFKERKFHDEQIRKLFKIKHEQEKTPRKNTFDTFVVISFIFSLLFSRFLLNFEWHKKGARRKEERRLASIDDFFPTSKWH